MTCASVVFPRPGGPHSRATCRERERGVARSDCTARGTALPSALVAFVETPGEGYHGMKNRTGAPRGDSRPSWHHLCLSDIYRTIEKGAGNTLKNYIPMKLPSIYFCFPVVFFLIIFHQMLQSYKMACVCYLCSFHPFSSPAPFWMQKHLPKAMPCLSLVNKVKPNL